MYTTTTAASAIGKRQRQRHTDDVDIQPPPAINSFAGSAMRKQLRTEADQQAFRCFAYKRSRSPNPPRPAFLLTSYKLRSCVPKQAVIKAC